MTNLERRYRRLLRLLPAWYRARREEEMVGIFLVDRDDDTDLEYGWPGWGEAFATFGLAVRTRFAADGAPARATALGEVVRLVALLGLLVQIAVVAEDVTSAVRFDALGGPDALVFEGGMLITAVAMFAGYRRVAKALILLLVLAGVVHVVSTEGPAAWFALAAQVPLWITAPALFLGFHSAAPALRTAPWWRAAAVAVPVGIGWALVGSGWLGATAVIVAGVVVLLRRGPVVWALALAVWANAYVPVQSAGIAYVEPVARVELAALVLVMALLTVFGLRRLAVVTP